MLPAYANATVEVDRHAAPLYDMPHRPRHRAGKWVARHLQGAAGRKTSAAGRRGGTLSPRAAGTPTRGPPRFFSPQPPAPPALSPRMRPFPALAAVAAAASLVAAAPAAAATWTPPATVSAPHTFISPLDAARAGNGTAVLTWGFQDGIGANAPAGARGALFLPGAAAFGPERTLPAATSRVVPYAQRSAAALLQTSLDATGRRVRLSVAFGSAVGPSLGTPRTVATDDVAFVPSLAMGSDGSGLLAWVGRTGGNRRVVKVSLRAPGGRFGTPSIISGTGRANAIIAAVGSRGERVVAFERSGRLLVRYRAPGR